MTKQIINPGMIMMEQKEVHTFNILILTINTYRLYQNQFLMV